MGLEKVMIVDDEQDVLEALGPTIEAKYNCKVVKAESGKEALRKYEEEHPGLIILDLVMADGSGEYFLEELKKKTNEDSKPYVIILTGAAMSPQRQMDLHLKFDIKDLFVKPAPKEFYKTIDEINSKV